MLLLSLIACEELSLLTLFMDPADPEFISVAMECAEDELSLVALVDSEVEASNLVVELYEEDGDLFEAVFPLNDLNQADGQVTRWSASAEHDCDDSLNVDWTVWTIQETSATTASRYPEGAPEVEPLDPPWGSTLGGDVVAIDGEWLDEVVSIILDGQETPTWWDGDTLVFETPAHEAGEVSVEIVGEHGSTWETFTYYPDQTGQVRGIGNMGLSFYSEDLLGYDSAYGAVDGPFAQFEVLMHEPTDPANTWWGRHPEVGECEWSSGEGTTLTPVGSYLGLEDLDGDLGQFALVTSESTGTYYLLSEADESWAGTTFELSWNESLEDLPAMSVGLTTAAMPGSPNLGWEAAEDWPKGEDVVLDFVPDADLVGAYVAWFVTTSGNGVLDSASCMHDATGGELTLPWDELTAAADPDAAARIYLRVSYWNDEEIVLPHDRSVFWSRGVTTIWYRLELIEP